MSENAVEEAIHASDSKRLPPATHQVGGESQLVTSTPHHPQQQLMMDFSFLKCYEHIATSSTAPSAVDTDSGYMSNPLESTSFGDPTVYINKSPPYMSEDALLEQPASVKKTLPPNQSVYQEQISYLGTMYDDTSAAADCSSSVVMDTEDEVEMSPIVLINRQPLVVRLSELDDASNSSNKENIDFEAASSRKMANVKKTPRKTPRKRRRTSSSSSSVTATPKKQLISTPSADFSPDLFADNEPTPVAQTLMENLVVTELYGQKNDQALIKRLQPALSGVPPPPSVTTTHVTVAQMLEKLTHEKQQAFYWSNALADSIPQKSLLLNTNVEECKVRDWPDILHDRCHGLNYNHSKYAEDTEALFMKYMERYIGAETQSSCTVFNAASTSTTRRANRRLIASPGRRLSHLARRRITFSSANIQAAGHSRQIMVDAKRFELLSRRVSPRKGKSPRKLLSKSPRKGISPRKTPRKTPGKGGKMRTPSSSMKKRLKIIGDENAVPSTSLRASATKRALFQSPDKSARQTRASTSRLSPNLAKTNVAPKRALFASPNGGGKRKRLDSGNDIVGCKFARSISLQSESKPAVSGGGGALTRVKSESLLHASPVELSEHHKKKLQWAVYEALRSVNIRVDHANFKQFASVLARITRRLLPSVSVAANVGTSEKMLRITKQHVYAVTKGKSVDEIVRQYESARLKTQKPTGYVAKEAETAEVKDVAVARSNALQDCANTLQSMEKKQPPLSEKKAGNKVDRVKKIIKF